MILPLALADSAPVSLNSAPEAQRCLVVDDERRLRQVLVRLMESDGFTCIEASNGADALDVLRRMPVTLILTDLRMPQMDGVELLREVRARYPDTAVVLITAVAEVETAVRCLAIGAMDYLTKPFHLEEVRARVSQAMEKRRLILDNRGYQEQLEQRVAGQARRLEALFLASIQSLADALEVKDPYTRGHSVRVSHYASVISRALGLDPRTIHQIELGGHVHDIGKIGVREAVLNKPGPLTDEEYAHIMTHPVAGWRILSPLLADAPGASVILNVVRWHHERYDGLGIPDGLAGEAIPFEARIAAVADSFDAMTSRRPYRGGSSMTLTQAVAELERCSGTQFDPTVVRAFVAAVGEGEIDLAPDARAELADRAVVGSEVRRGYRV
ncbi:MAG TPA: HD domain-containing phosphohydrolase [Gemmatimonadaceae bacterium]|nr:HD domain-containing phosphohydrolase [Gemmatimonadaceae bacterium]